MKTNHSTLCSVASLVSSIFRYCYWKASQKRLTKKKELQCDFVLCMYWQHMVIMKSYFDFRSTIYSVQCILLASLVSSVPRHITANSALRFIALSCNLRFRRNIQQFLTRSNFVVALFESSLELSGSMQSFVIEGDFTSLKISNTLVYYKFISLHRVVKMGPDFLIPCPCRKTHGSQKLPNTDAQPQPPESSAQRTVYVTLHLMAVPVALVVIFNAKGRLAPADDILFAIENSLTLPLSCVRL